ncbi:1144_t:CDS:1, partial [Gigaspora margarita]
SSQQCACRYNSDCENDCTFPVWDWCLNGECVKPCSQNSDCALNICNNGTILIVIAQQHFHVDGRNYGDYRICKDDKDCAKTGILGFNIVLMAIVSNVVLMINAIVDKFVEKETVNIAKKTPIVLHL